MKLLGIGILALATFGVMGVMVGVTLPGITAEAGGLQPFDMRMGGYSLEEARAFLTALTEKGRALYLGPQHLLDAFYPALMAALEVMIFRALLPRTLALGGGIIALAACAADWAENFLVRGLLRAGAEAVTEAQVATASTVSTIKLGLGMVALAAVVVTLILAVLRRVRR